LCPSSWLTAITKKYGFNSFTLNNLTTIQPCSSLYARKTIELNFVAAGGLVLNKGVVFFAEKIVKYPNVTLTIFGNGGTENDQIKIQHLSLLSGNRIQYKGLLEHEKLLKQFSIFSFLIVPSLWMENYPTIVIEGMINKICVIASDRGGARELLADGRGILFSWDDESSIENVIERISNIDVNEYNHIVKKAYDYVCENNNPAIYYDRLISLIN
jgi:glycosyltransferase involved in cell wall biosynthesis